MTYDVHLADVYEGPLDLLLQLVSKERVDVAMISISTITDEYLRAVKYMDEVDINTASAFLVLAATLLELKSMKLLPRHVVDDPELSALLEERDHLIHRLIEYSTFKAAAGVISQLLEEGQGFFTRSAEIPQELIPALPDILEGLTSDKLAVAAALALSPKPVPTVELSHVTPIRVSVAEMLDELLEQIRVKGTMRFGEFKRQATQRIEVVIRFLALLELFKSQRVDLEQESPFSDIVIRWRRPRTP